MANIYALIEKFFKNDNFSKLEIYNEISLQHELGIFLRGHLPNFRIQFERNVKYFNLNGIVKTKKEIDIVIFDSTCTEKYSIELKHPLNGQNPEQMYSFIKDIKFSEELVSKELGGFNSAFCIILVRDKVFYSGTKKSGIYQYFRTGKELSGKVEKPTGEQVKQIELNGKYKIDWKYINETYSYCVLQIK